MRREQLFPGVALIALALGLGLGLGHVVARSTAASDGDLSAGLGGEVVAGPAATFSTPGGSIPAPGGAADRGRGDDAFEGADIDGSALAGLEPAPAGEPLVPTTTGRMTPASRSAAPSMSSTVPVATAPSSGPVASGVPAAGPVSVVPVANLGTSSTVVTSSSTTTRAVSTTTTSAPAATPATVTPPAGLSRMEQGVLDAVNAARRANGCPALTVDASLQAAAHAYAAFMVQQHWFDHDSPSGQSPTDRARAAGYRGGVGENLMMGFKGDPRGAVTDPTYGWLQSDGHRRNILNCDYTKTGVGYDPGNIQVGYADGSWVQMFG